MSVRPTAWVVLAVAMAALTACHTTPEPSLEADAPPEPAPPAQFEPTSYVAPIQQGEGRYPNLYAPTSFAVWVGPEVTAFKREQAQASGQTVEPWIDNAATIIPENYVVVECHVASAFPDSSIAYDVVGFRGMDLYLEFPDGRRVKPIQVLIDTHARESSQGTLKSFSRINLLVFPRRDLLLGESTLPAEAPSARLVIAGVGSRFHFDWPGMGAPRTSSWIPAAQEAAQAVQLGFRDLFGRLQRLAHIFD